MLHMDLNQLTPYQAILSREAQETVQLSEAVACVGTGTQCPQHHPHADVMA